MKKIFLILVMIALCGGYFFSVKMTGKQFARAEKKVDVQKELLDLQAAIKKSDLSTVQEVIELNNKVMQIYYSRYTTKEHIETYTDTIRMLYSMDLLTLNEKSQQEKILVAEMEQNSKKPLLLLNSEIKEVQVIEDDTVLVKVVHYTNASDISRQYSMKKEKESWKIEGWENLDTHEDKAEE